MATKSVSEIAMVFRLDFTVLGGRLLAQVIRADSQGAEIKK